MSMERAAEPPWASANGRGSGSRGALLRASALCEFPRIRLPVKVKGIGIRLDLDVPLDSSVRCINQLNPFISSRYINGIVSERPRSVTNVSPVPFGNPSLTFLACRRRAQRHRACQSCASTRVNAPLAT